MQLRVDYRTYQVVPMPQDVHDENGWLGCCRKPKGVIELWPHQPDDELADTLVHEVLHAIWSTRGLPDEAEEATVTALAHGLTALMRDNPLFFPTVQKILQGQRPVNLRR